MYETAEESRSNSIAYHLTPVEVWERQRNANEYLPEGFERDGFIHATNGLVPLLDVANRYYKSDFRPYIVLVLEVRAIAAEVRYDDPGNLYPHVYGALNTDSVVATMASIRGGDGQFLAFEGSA